MSYLIELDFIFLDNKKTTRQMGKMWTMMIDHDDRYAWLCECNNLDEEDNEKSVLRSVWIDNEVCMTLRTTLWPLYWRGDMVTLSYINHGLSSLGEELNSPPVHSHYHLLKRRRESAWVVVNPTIK